MSSKKNQNSILFLTTLGVYIGLLMAGAGPGVVAQQAAAMTRNFDVKDEIEFKDDLDNKPDECDFLRNEAGIRSTSYGGRVESFVEYAFLVDSLVRVLSDANTLDRSFSAESSPSDFRSVSVSVDFGAKPFLAKAGTVASIDSQLGQLVRIVPKAGHSKELKFSFDYAPNATEVTLTSNFFRTNSSDAHRLFIALKASHNLWQCATTNRHQSLVLNNTDIRRSESQVLIVTRLPRAALDTLLANTAK